MKVLGLAAEVSWRKQYIAIVSHDELEMVSDKRYGESKLKELKAGDEFDLGAGCNFRDQIKDACSKMQSAMSSFDSARNTLMRFAVLIAEKKPQPSSEAPASATGAA